MLKIGIIRECKTPPDTRVALTPKQCAFIQHNYPVKIVVESSPIRSFKDEEYVAERITVSDKINDCDVLLGVKEVPIDKLLEGKTYFFFSHTIKKQPYNKKLLRSILDKKIRLIDYETLVDDEGGRLIAFGKYAGVVGAHNALWTYGKKTNTFDMKRMVDCHDYAEALQIYKNLKLPPVKIVLTGTGRVASGAEMVLRHMEIFEVSPEDFLTKTYNKPVFTQLDCSKYVKRISDGKYDKKEFYAHPDLYESSFLPYIKVSDIFINGIYWNNQSPKFFTLDDMKSKDFNIKVIADVTCDIAPLSSVPSTIRPSTIKDPVYGFDTQKCEEVAPFTKGAIDIMAIDNLPNELPRDASQFFGEQFIKNILVSLLEGNENPIIKRATIAANGNITKRFDYLSEWVNAS